LSSSGFPAGLSCIVAASLYPFPVLFSSRGIHFPGRDTLNTRFTPLRLY